MLRRLLVTTAADQTARIWSTADFSLLQELKHDDQRWVWDAAFSADSQYIFTGRLTYFLRNSNLSKMFLFFQPLRMETLNYGTLNQGRLKEITQGTAKQLQL